MAKKILFFGDSITDACRREDAFCGMGAGYATMVNGELGAEYPNEYEFINMGIGGHRIVDLYARLKSDFLNHKPDYASIYCGVNDSWHEILYQNGVNTPKFEKVYQIMLDEILEELPNIKLILIAPYVVEGRCTCNTEEMPDRLQQFEVDVAEKAAAVKRIAEKYNLPLIELQPIFDEACKKAPSTYWTTDGVHPMIAGHTLIKNAWIKEFKKLI
ncbi:MAG: SGNH/GDSL hydrolase family protein [Clostridia bacterium]|nr:SGNH/GDSL hydrolase family protein [Clostridia bacterium]